MTTRATEPHTMSPRPRRSSWLWVIAGAVVIAAVVVTLVLTASGTDDDRDATGTGTGTSTGAGNPSTGKPGTGPGAGYDLSTPQAAAESFATAAGTGSGDTLLGLACVGRPSCIREHAADLDETQLAEAQNTVRDGVYELSEHLEGADFTSAVDGPEPGTKDVPYRTPAMTGDAYLTLTFIQSDGDWLFFLPA